MKKSSRFIVRNIPIFLSLLLLSIVGYIFWFISRYPSLSGKAASATHTDIPDLISFNVWIKHSAEYNDFMNLLVSFFNRCFTNYKGMTFGLLFGAGLLTLLSFYKIKNYSHNRFVQALIGFIQGVGLGVCVNCATPIGKSLLKSGVPKVMSISTMVSSPSLNVVSFGLIFSIFPWYIASGKILFSLIIILLVIPLIFFDKKEKIHTHPVESKLIDSDSVVYQVMIFFKVFFKNLFYILKTTLPLMLLGGFIGISIASLIPQSQLGLMPVRADLIVLTAIVGFLLPVPMFFDLIFAGILLSTSISSIYAIVLLLTLGGFSIYPLMMLYFEVDKTKLTGFCTTFNLLAIIFSLGMYNYKLHSDTQFIQNFENIDFSNDDVASSQYEEMFAPGRQYTIPGTQAPTIEWMTQYKKDALQVLSTGYAKSTDSFGKFKALKNEDIGIQKRGTTLGGLSFGGVSAGDYNNDGWQDMVVSSSRGVQVYKNVGGKFELTDFDFPSEVSEGNIINSALYDLNADGLKDMLIATKFDGIYIFWNDSFSYSQDDVYHLEAESPVNNAYGISFGDLFEDGNIDVFVGLFALDDTGKNIGNFILKNLGNKKIEKLDFNNVIRGPATVSMIYDFDSDARQEIFVGNDYEPGDVLYDVENREISAHSDAKKFFPLSPAASMNISIGDINNDLIPEYYLSGEAGIKTIRGKSEDILEKNSSCVFPSGVGEELTGECKIAERVAFNIRNNTCENLKDSYLYNKCIQGAITASLGTIERKLIDDKLCKKLESIYEGKEAYFFCSHLRNGQINSFKKQDSVIKSKKSGNVFLRLNKEKNEYEDSFPNKEIENTGWAWGGVFEDFDQNGWQDLYITNGYFRSVGKPISNVLFANSDGKFTDTTQEMGLESVLDTVGVIAFDYDNDGDLDIVNNTIYGGIVFFENQSLDTHSVQIELVDHLSANTSGIGAKVIITDENDNKQMRVLVAGGSFMGYSPLIAHFGLAGVANIKSIEIIWANAEVSQLQGDFGVNKRYKVVRGE